VQIEGEAALARVEALVHAACAEDHRTHRDDLDAPLGEAIEIARREVPSLIVLDLVLPDVDGFEVIQFARGQDKLRALPIIVVTTRGDDSSMGRAMGAGATRFMTKPFGPEAILSEVRALLGGTPVVAAR